MKKFSEFVDSLSEDKDWSKHPKFDSGPFGKGTSSNPHFPTMSDSSLKRWIRTRQQNAAAHALSPMRSKQLTKAQKHYEQRTGKLN